MAEENVNSSLALKLTEKLGELGIVIKGIDMSQKAAANERKHMQQQLDKLVDDSTSNIKQLELTLGKRLDEHEDRIKKVEGTDLKKEGVQEWIKWVFLIIGGVSSAGAILYSIFTLVQAGN